MSEPLHVPAAMHGACTPILLCASCVTWLGVQVVIAGLLGRFYSNAMPTDVSIVVVVFVCLFVSGHAWSWGARCEAGCLLLNYILIFMAIFCTDRQLRSPCSALGACCLSYQPECEVVHPGISL